MREEPPRARAALGLGQLHQLERIFDVVDRAQPGKQSFAIILEHVAELDVAERLAGEQDFTGVGGISPAIMLISVLLPQPFGPKIETSFPRGMSRSKRS